jgi:hypothetical protein
MHPPPRSTSRRRPATAAALVALALAAGACAQRRWSEPIARFKTDVDRSVVVVSAYYTALNDYERHLYLERAYADPAEELLLVDATGHPTPLAGLVFTARAIRARTDALALVSLYARRLADLAGSNASATFARNAGALGSSLKQLPATLTELAHADPGAAAYVKPVTGLLGAVGQMYLETRRDEALERAIADGAPEVRAVLRALGEDLAGAIDPLEKTGEREVLAQLVVDYNENRTRWSESRRRRQIADIEKAARGFAAAVASDPTDVLRGLADAHEALVQFARSGRGPADRANLSSALAIFSQRVDSAAAMVRALGDTQ